MNAAKAYRKLKEVEETKLANRLMLLRLELQKSQRKIDETEKRTNSILEHKQAIEQRNKEKVEEMKRKVEEKQMAQQINQIARTRMAIIRRSKVKSVAEQKREDAQAIIAARRAHYDSIEQQKEETMRRALAVKNFVKATLDNGKELRRRDAIQRREAARAAFADRVRLEAAKSKEAEEKVAIMEAEELKLIKLLEATQEYQRGAYHELEGALVSSRRSISTAQEELRQVMASSLSSRTHSRLRQNDVDAIALATLPPVIRRKVAPLVGDEKENGGGSTPRKPQPPTGKRPTPAGKAKQNVAATKQDTTEPAPADADADVAAATAAPVIASPDSTPTDPTPAADSTPAPDAAPAADPAADSAAPAASDSTTATPPDAATESATNSDQPNEAQPANDNATDTKADETETEPNNNAAAEEAKTE